MWTHLFLTLILGAAGVFSTETVERLPLPKLGQPQVVGCGATNSLFSLAATVSFKDKKLLPGDCTFYYESTSTPAVQQNAVLFPSNGLDFLTFTARSTVDLAASEQAGQSFVLTLSCGPWIVTSSESSDVLTPGSCGADAAEQVEEGCLGDVCGTSTPSEPVLLDEIDLSLEPIEALGTPAQVKMWTALAWLRRKVEEQAKRLANLAADTTRYEPFRTGTNPALPPVSTTEGATSLDDSTTPVIFGAPPEVLWVCVICCSVFGALVGFAATRNYFKRREDEMVSVQEKTVRQLCDEIAGLNGQVVRLQAEVEDVCVHRDSARSQCGLLEGRIRDLEEMLESRRQVSSELEQQLTELQQMRKSLTEKVEQFEAEGRVVEQQLSERDQMLCDVRRYMYKMQQELVQLQGVGASFEDTVIDDEKLDELFAALDNTLEDDLDLTDDFFAIKPLAAVPPMPLSAPTTEDSPATPDAFHTPQPMHVRFRGTPVTMHPTSLPATETDGKNSPMAVPGMLTPAGIPSTPLALPRPTPIRRRVLVPKAPATPRDGTPMPPSRLRNHVTSPAITPETEDPTPSAPKPTASPPTEQASSGLLRPRATVKVLFTGPNTPPSPHQTRPHITLPRPTPFKLPANTTETTTDNTATTAAPTSIVSESPDILPYDLSASSSPVVPPPTSKFSSVRFGTISSSPPIPHKTVFEGVESAQVDTNKASSAPATPQTEEKPRRSSLRRPKVALEKPTVTFGPVATSTCSDAEAPRTPPTPFRELSSNTSQTRSLKTGIRLPGTSPRQATN
eukprot:comp24225_c0_seq1/m.44638 comp24225_c0_seq1/g.44638  ORF comp24225_c0_seq1/g.44638 comp24225_c0_seq1/m.44638 type:complete len:790 (-) comp24225_c0_seq1:385-2754(-)